MELVIDVDLYNVGDVLQEVTQSCGVVLSDFLAPFRQDWTRKSPEPYQPSGDELITMLLACLPNLSRLILSSHGIYGAISPSALRLSVLSGFPSTPLTPAGAAQFLTASCMILSKWLRLPCQLSTLITAGRTHRCATSSLLCPA
jgi:hypothetical protein